MVKSLLRQKLQDKFSGVSFDVLVPPDDKMGDYSTNIAFVLATRPSHKATEGKEKKGEDPMKVGEELASELSRDKDLAGVFQKVEAVRPGFVNFFLKKEFLQKQLAETYKNIDSVGLSDTGNGKTVIVEYSSPNIAKPMHIGHLRSTIIGDSLANVYEKLGYKVIRWNYIGDWGTQFGKLIAAWKRWGDPEKLKTNPSTTLVELYVMFHQNLKKDPSLEGEGQREFLKLEQGDSQNRELWELFRSQSLEEFRCIYKDLNIGMFQIIKGESDYESKLKPLIVELQQKGIATESEGALVIELENLPVAMLQKSDGATLYMTRDLASLEDRIRSYQADKILYIVANQQTLHFEQLFAVAKKLGLKNAELAHVKFGMVLGEDGKKLATREGKVIPLQDVIDKIVALAGRVVKEKNPELSEKEASEIAKVVGIGALKYNDLKQHPHTDIVFDWKAMLDISGNSGPYLQYAYARLASIIAKAKNRKEGDVSLLTEPEEEKLMKRLLEFSDAVVKCMELNALNSLALYLYELSNEANRFYESIRVLEDENIDRRNARLVLIETAAAILKRGLGILGIETLKRI
ncbi:MAG: arginine--tRNA ligase [Candidatus Yanofskybacteria bacterium RIFCSPHIGHO2_01_FULL_42_12]|uniref:Arginine--tRNA ligase n=1 Tax=Candidatus Yanofskybacteria bacterium RIFCSPLOWO2_01_FULL_42_49 TaxID=1802694 RepID=A0A1F8GCV3_9BACT|nr:MAG: arginine--tRNA ligase [Candidatus Yanofskybacteria bacterium RIFCSPHIGHO2_01_FULL_42_12]OGN22576.1 MAG: arginine--tRNA ligase [Candidatus Yanofskybacteria bacterium RIFCSPLOWO2_01_FULL_42_49]